MKAYVDNIMPDVSSPGSANEINVKASTTYLIEKVCKPAISVAINVAHFYKACN